MYPRVQRQLVRLFAVACLGSLLSLSSGCARNFEVGPIYEGRTQTGRAFQVARFFEWFGRQKSNGSDQLRLSWEEPTSAQVGKSKRHEWAVIVKQGARDKLGFLTRGDQDRVWFLMPGDREPFAAADLATGDVYDEAAAKPAWAGAEVGKPIEMAERRPSKT